MKKRHALKATLALSTSLVSFASLAHAGGFNVVPGDLKGALDSYAKQAGIALAYREDAVVGVRTKGVVGDVTPGKALNRILSGTGFIARQHASGAITIVRDVQALNAPSENLPMLTLAQATAAPHAVETVTVTSSKLGGVDVQSIPISITALSQEQLTASQTNGGPDLVKQVPNLTFTKTNFSGYSIQIRGIGTQAISVTTDPAVAIAFNDTPFIRNHFFEQEFFDVAQVEILRGPQGTLYGRNATAGVVNITSAKPSDQFEAMVSGELGNYQSRRFEGMVNIPIVDDRVAIRIAGEWTKRKGYSFNELTDSSIDGRNLWSGRVTVGWKPMEKLQTYLIWEHFSEDDDRLRSSKQLCKTDPIPTSVGGQPVPLTTAGVFNVAPYLSQSCQMVSLYSPEAFQVPNGFSLPYYLGPQFNGLMNNTVDPYSRTTQSSDLRRIESQFTPDYGVKSNVVELSNTYEVSPSLTFVSETSFSNDFLRSTQDYNRFNTAPGVFTKGVRGMGTIGPITNYLIDRDGVFCDPQLGCSDRLLAMDMVVAKSWQAGQELRITSHFTGPFNFSFGGNYLHYETDENYYVFINSLTAFSWAQGGNTSEFPRGPWVPGVSDNSGCLLRYGGFKYYDPTKGGGSPNVNACTYIDPNPVTNLNDKGHNYFLSQNPYTLNSFAAFGESYYEILSDLKATVGLRYTEDRKHFTMIPSELLAVGWGYPSTGEINQQWGQFTGRAVLNWTPKLNFTDQTLVFGSYSHGYKAGGANPPGAVLLIYGGEGNNPNPIHPTTFKPEFIDAFELGTKNALFDSTLTFNASAFYFNYQGYQISEIVDRSAINRNFNANVKGAEVEATWEPIPGLRFNMSGGYEDARVARGQKGIDLMDRTAGDPNYMVMKPFATQASNCIFPVSEVVWLLKLGQGAYQDGAQGNPAPLACGVAYVDGHDPITGKTYKENPGGTDSFFNYPVDPNYPGFNPATVPNNGAGIDKDLGHHMLPNAPPFTFSAGGQYSMPVTADWAATLRGDFYWQDDSWARVFNDNPYDRIHGYTNLNLSLILTSQSGWQVMGFAKNVLNTTAITGAFLNSDDSGLTTNVFLTDPRLIGVRVTKNW